MDSTLDDAVLVALGRRIREVRLSKKLRQNEVARRCGFHRGGYNNIEAGRRNISILTLYKVAFALEEPISSFFDEGDFKIFLAESKLKV